MRLTSQPRLVGQRRRPRSSAFTRKLDAAVRAEALHFRVSKSFVIAVAVADQLGVELEDEARYKKARG